MSTTEEGSKVTAATIASRTTNRRTTGSHAALQREHVLDRLQHLRSILPVFAEELASSRRQAAALRVENRGLLEEVRRLRALHGHNGGGSAR